MTRIRSKLAAPPGSLFFYERNGVRVEERSYDAAVSAVSRLLSAMGVKADAELELAAYMCPRIGRDASWFCVSDSPQKPEVTPREAVENSLAAVAGRLVAPFDRIERRLAVCRGCPRHERNWCPTCAGHFERILVSLSGRRPRLPADRLAGVCACAKAYESALCSVDYKTGEPVWEDAPDTCWRRKGDV